MGTAVTSHQLPPSQSESQGSFLTAIFYSPFSDVEQICPFAFPHHCLFFSCLSLCPLDLCRQMPSPHLYRGARPWVTSGLCPSFHPMSRIAKGPASKNFVGGRHYSILSPGDGSALSSGCPAPTAAAARGHTYPDSHGSLFHGKDINR